MLRQRKEIYTPQMLELIAQTRKATHVKVAGKLIPRPLPQDDYDHIDGVGSKAKALERAGKLRNIAYEALCGNLNDLAVDDAIPSTTSDVIVSPKDDPGLFVDLVAALADYCCERGIVITTGDTDLNREAGYVDMFVAIHGYRRRKNGVLPENRFRIGDCLIGLASSGPHSNGFTLYRRYFGENLGPEFLEPTELYYDGVMKVNEEMDVHARVNITGGGLLRVLGKLPPNADAEIRGAHPLNPHPLFYALYERMESRFPAPLVRILRFVPWGHRAIGLAGQGWQRCLREEGMEAVDREIYSWANCGMGFLIGLDKVDAPRALGLLADFGIRAAVVGEVTTGTGRVRIKSKFSGKWFEYM